MQSKHKEGDEAKRRQEEWDKRKNKWIAEVESLYMQIQEWLEPLNETASIRFDIGTHPANEENIGSYNIQHMTIHLANERVELTPRGTNIIGGYGRIDMYGKNGQKMLVIPKWGEWAFYRLDTTNPSMPKQFYDPLNEGSFKEALLDLIS